MFATEPIGGAFNLTRARAVARPADRAGLFRGWLRAAGAVFPGRAGPGVRGAG
jgi:hypothetical protein